MKIAVTGMGAINAMGVGREAFWEACRHGQSGIRKIGAFETHRFRTNVAGCVEGFKPAQFMAPMIYRRLSRISRLAVSSAIEAMEDSRLPLEEMNTQRVAVVMGTAYGSSSHVDAFYLSLLRDGPRGAQPMLFPETVPNAPASHIAMLYGITGPNITFCQNDLSAESALSYALNLLAGDRVDIAIVGGAEELSEILFGCYDAVGALNRLKVRQGEPVRPAPAGGLVLGEGSTTLILERLDHAHERGARIYGTLNSLVISGGESAMGHYERQGEQAARAMEEAMARAGIRSRDIDHISISANFSKELDRMEYEQVGRLFQIPATSLRVTPLKYLTGDFGAAGATRAAAVLLSLFHQQPLPWLPLASLLPETELPSHSWRTDGAGDIRYALMTSTTFGGGSCSMVFEKY